MSYEPPSLEDFTRAEFDQHTFPGMDAGTVFLPSGSEPEGRIKQALDGVGQKRAYLVDGGHIIKVPWFHVQEFTDLFGLEKNGWDHEHCDFCGASIAVGQRCWTTRDEEFKVACLKCFEKLRDEGAEPGATDNPDDAQRLREDH